MQVAIARMKDIRDPQLILRGDAVHVGQDFRQTRSRHDCVWIMESGQFDDCAERAFACGPKFLSFMIIAREATGSRSILNTDTLDSVSFVVDAGFDSSSSIKRAAPASIGKPAQTRSLQLPG